MLSLLIANWRYVVMALLLAAVAFYRWDAQSWEKKYYTFEASVKAIGEAQERATAEKVKADKLAKEKADAEHKAAVSNLRVTIARLRDERSRSSLLPAAPAETRRPDLAAFDREQFDRALREFEEATARLLEEGSEAVVNLDTAKRWAQSP